MIQGKRKPGEGLDGQRYGVEDDSQPKHLEEDETGAGVEPGPGAEAALQVGVGRGEPAGPKEGHEQKQGRQIGDEIGHVTRDVTPVLLVGEPRHGQEGHGTDDGGHQGDPHDPTRHAAAGEEVGLRRLALAGRVDPDGDHGPKIQADHQKIGPPQVVQHRVNFSRGSRNSTENLASGQVITTQFRGPLRRASPDRGTTSTPELRYHGGRKLDRGRCTGMGPRQ